MTCSEKIDEKVAEEMAKEFNYSSAVLKELCEFLRAMHEFTHYLQENRYYSEILNKKVFELTLQLELVALKMNLLRLRDEELYADVEKAVLRKEKPKTNKADVEKLEKETEETKKEAEKLYSGLQRILSDILAEYRQKNA
ncbi:hypothetical protein H0O03_00845 [Candidatus Micrarchaeota archaeon]|nr:hypothetical protein [Candidatus Micrarchaeota archaeon]